MMRWNPGPARVLRAGLQVLFPVLVFASASRQLGAAPSAQEPRAPSEAQIEAAARTIDELVERDLAAHELAANRVVDQPTFVRRAYLAVAGRIPTLAELEDGLRGGIGRRGELIDRLLGSPGHQSHLFNWWADLLRVRTRLNRQVSGEPYIHWLKTVLAENRPYDAMVREMLAAEGPAHARGNGATGYHLRDLGMPEDDTANTLRLFLGTRLECAQCHDHPFDKWKQKQFYELVAFNGGMQYRTGFENSDAAQALRDTARAMMAEHGQRAQQAVRQMVQVATLGVVGSGTGYARLPANYQYPDAKPGQPVQARVPFGPAPELALSPLPPSGRQARRPQRRAARGPVGKPADSRAAFAQWVTSDDNTRFAVVIANRYWKRTFGRGLIEPLDDLRDDTEASNPPLLAFLAELVVDLDYDLRAFERVLLRTRLFQREAVSGDESGTPRFAGPYLRRMSAEQVWDSLLTLVVQDLDATLRPAGARAEEVYARYEKLASATPDELRQEVQATVLRRTDPQRFRAMLAEQARERSQQDEEKLKQARPLFRQLAAARRRGDTAAEETLVAELRQLGVPLPGDRVRRNRGGQALQRASDLPAPAPAGHLLRQFGQSDRETIDAGFTDASVPQVLTLLNGFVDQRLFERNSVLRRALEARKGLAAKVEVAFQAILGREPTAAERAEWTRGADEASVRDLVWVLVNSHEFRFIR